MAVEYQEGFALMNKILKKKLNMNEEKNEIDIVK